MCQRKPSKEEDEKRDRTVKWIFNNLSGMNFQQKTSCDEILYHSCGTLFTLHTSSIYVMAECHENEKWQKTFILQTSCMAYDMPQLALFYHENPLLPRINNVLPHQHTFTLIWPCSTPLTHLYPKLPMFYHVNPNRPKVSHVLSH